MGIHTEAVQKLYVAYFSRPADFGGLDYWEKVVAANNGDTSMMSAAFAASQEYKDTYAGKSSFQIINTIYQNLFGRDAEPAALLFWGNALNNNDVTIDSAVTTIAAAAQTTDATAYANKVAAATAFTAALDTTPEILGYSGEAANGAAREWLAGVTNDASLAAAIEPATLNASIGIVSGNGTGNNNGQTYQFTRGLDSLTGTAGNDLYIGSISKNAELNTLSSLDALNGGGGVDTLRILTDGADIVLPTLLGVEIIEAQSSADVVIDTATVRDLLNLNITRANGDVTANAGANTDIAVTLANPTRSETIAVNGGNDVAVNLTGVRDAINVYVGVADAAPTAPTGDVAVNVAGRAYVAGQDTDLGLIMVNGGSTISVTQKAALNTNAAGTDTKAGTVEQGSVSIIGSQSTTTVTVKQDAAVEASNAQYTTGGATETTSVKFSALTAQQSLTIGGLTFTANVDMTAAEVASAFANLIEANLPAWGVIQRSSVADMSMPMVGDTQGSGLASKGTYTGAFSGWTSGAASGDTVVFTSTTDNSNIDPDLAISGNAVGTTTNGKSHNAGAEGGVMGVIAGQVHIADSMNTIKTVTIDGYSVEGSRMNGQVLGTPAAPAIGGASLETLNLSNGGDFSTGASATLALNLQNVWHTAAREATIDHGAEAAQAADIAITAGATTLNLKTVGDNAARLDLAATTTLNVSGNGTLSASGSTMDAVTSIKVTESAGLDLSGTELAALTSVDTTGTTGDVTMYIDGGKTTYTGGAGVDYVGIRNDVTKSISLGAGDDALDLRDIEVSKLVNMAANVTLDGGAGTDILALSAGAAATLSSSSAFEGKISGFEKLGVGTIYSNTVVNLDNLDDINYVITTGSGYNGAPHDLDVITTDGVAGITEFNVVAFNTLTGLQSITVNGRQVNLNGAAVQNGAIVLAEEIAEAFRTNTSTANLVIAGTPTGTWNITAGVNTGTLVYTSTTPTLDVDSLQYSSVGASTPVVATTEGVAPSNETAVVQFHDLHAGQSYTVGGLTVTSSGYASAEDVARAFVSGSSRGDLVVTGSLNNAWGVSYVGNTASDTAEFTSKIANANVTDLVVSGSGTSNATTLTLDKMLNNATVELTGEGNVAVQLADASGTADVVNLIANAWSGANIGTVTANKVETINISANNTADWSTIAVSDNALTLAADAVKTINVSGAGNLTLNLDASTKLVTAIDGSTATGNLQLSSSGASDAVAVTLTGGSGNDYLVARGNKADVLIGGAGDDTLVAGRGLATLTGGAGNDLFKIVVASDTVNSYATITDFGVGDLLQFSNENMMGRGAPSQGAFVTEKIALGATAVFQDYANAAVKAIDSGDITWFQFSGDTYVVADMGSDSATTFQNGQDFIVKLTGLIDLSNASFNADYGTIGLV